jgi:ABC-type multidrug transport system fused ATPase/permease subunit
MHTLYSSDINAMEHGIGDSLSIAIQMIAAFPTGLIIGLFYSWELALIVLAATPLFLAISGLVIWVGFFVVSSEHLISNLTPLIIFFFQFGTKLTNKELSAYAKANNIAMEVLSSMRTVVAFDGQQSELKRCI